MEGAADPRRAELGASASAERWVNHALGRRVAIGGPVSHPSLALLNSPSLPYPSCQLANAASSFFLLSTPLATHTYTHTSHIPPIIPSSSRCRVRSLALRHWVVQVLAPARVLGLVLVRWGGRVRDPSTVPAPGLPRVPSPLQALPPSLSATFRLRLALRRPAWLDPAHKVPAPAH